MNAYEMAEILDMSGCGEEADMLRQQADRIKRKQDLIREQTALLVKQNNRIAELEKQVEGYQTATKHYREKSQIKELSDEELWEIWDARIFTNPVGFYRTAIKKASEK